MQATSSQVIPATPDPAPLFLASELNEMTTTIVPIELRNAARDAGRDHLLVRRRRRSTRRAMR